MLPSGLQLNKILLALLRAVICKRRIHVSAIGIATSQPALSKVAGAVDEAALRIVLTQPVLKGAYAVLKIIWAGAKLIGVGAGVRQSALQRRQLRLLTFADAGGKPGDGRRTHSRKASGVGASFDWDVAATHHLRQAGDGPKALAGVFLKHGAWGAN